MLGVEQMNEVIEILKKMGAQNVQFIQSDGDDVLTFLFDGDTVILRGSHYNDSTGGIVGQVEKNPDDMPLNPAPGKVVATGTVKITSHGKLQSTATWTADPINESQIQDVEQRMKCWNTVCPNHEQVTELMLRVSEIEAESSRRLELMRAFVSATRQLESTAAYQEMVAELERVQVIVQKDGTR